jgi:hypothetical protein
VDRVGAVWTRSGRLKTAVAGSDRVGVYFESEQGLPLHADRRIGCGSGAPHSHQTTLPDSPAQSRGYFLTRLPRIACHNNWRAGYLPSSARLGRRLSRHPSSGVAARVFGDLTGRVPTVTPPTARIRWAHFAGGLFRPVGYWPVSTSVAGFENGSGGLAAGFLLLISAPDLP